MARTDRRRVGTPTERALARLLAGVPAGGRVDVAGMLAEPEVTVEAFTSTVDADGVETSSEVGVTLDTFHFLRQRLEVSSPLTAWLQREAAKGPDDGWWDVMVRWAKARHVDDVDVDGWGWSEVYTPNVDNFLSDELEIVTYVSDVDTMAVIRRADYGRGRPYVFHVMSSDANDLFDWDTWSIAHRRVWAETQASIPGMPALPRPEWHTWEREAPASDGWITESGDYVRLSDYASYGHLSTENTLVWQRVAGDAAGWRARCPLDGELCEVRPPYTF